MIHNIFTASSINRLFWDVWVGSSRWECQWLSVCWRGHCIFQNEGWNKKLWRSVRHAADVPPVSLFLSHISLSSLQVRWVSHPHLGRQLSCLLFTSINTQPTLYLVWRGRCSSVLPLYGCVQTSRLCVLLSESSARSQQLIHSLCCVLWEEITEECDGFRKQRLDPTPCAGVECFYHIALYSWIIFHISILT